MLRAGQFAAMLAVLLLIACGDDGSTTSTGNTGGQGASGGQGGQGGQGGGETGGQGGQGGQGGVAPNYGPPASDFVSAGGVSKSAGYRLVGTLGQSTQNQSKMSSPKYRLQGGLTGAIGSLP